MNELVTVIVPVYNVEKYLDRCVESIVNQTYTNLEIVLINDGSTDNSLEKCLEWKSKDDRIKVIDKENEGLGPTRNLGTKRALGEWIVYIDSDDWVVPQYVEKLLLAVLKDDADLAVCNMTLFCERTHSEKVQRRIEENTLLQTEDEKLDFIKWAPHHVATKIYRRKFLLDNQIMQPATTMQDTAVLVQLIACAKKISLIVDSLYYYWVDRNTSISNVKNKALDCPDIIKYSVDEMKRLGLFEEYKDTQLLFLYRSIIGILKKYATSETYECLYKEYSILFDEFFPGWQKKVEQKWLVYGSFNARWVAHVCSHSGRAVSKHYAFSSLISLFLGKQGCQYEVVHDNPFRRKAVEEDIKGIGKGLKLSNEAGILIDFLNERNDILETEEGVYISDSEAFKECMVTGLVVKRAIPYGSMEYMQLWEKACLELIKYLQNEAAKRQVYLLKMRMAKGYGCGKIDVLYDDQERIKSINQVIEEMEQFFLANYVEAIFVEGGEELYYTSDGQDYGIEPYYLNKRLYRNIRDEMEKNEKEGKVLA